MDANVEDLKARFRLLPDDELLSRYASRSLTKVAEGLAIIELQSRGIALPPQVEADESEDEEPYYGDWVRIARSLTPTDAHILCGYLNAAGVPAEACDTNTVQVNSLIAFALGGASVRVPKMFVREAQEFMDAFQRGDLALGEDFDEE